MSKRKDTYKKKWLIKRVGEDMKNYYIVKNQDDKTITYLEYDKLSGYDVTPRNVKIKDAIDVNKMVIINPSMIGKMVTKTVDLRFAKLLKFVSAILNTDDESGEAYRQALTEITKLRLEVFVKYKSYMTKEQLDILEKKLNILEREAKLRLLYLEQTNINNYNEEETKGSRRSR